MKSKGHLDVGGKRVLTNLSFFSGVGGLDLGARMAGGIQTICYCENDRYAQGVLRSRISDNQLDKCAIWDDVNTFDGKPWQGTDIVSGGFPCTDVSVAGKRAGIEVGTRSGLFYELMRVCREIRPRFILLENVAGLLIYPGAHRVFGELARMGFDAGWKIISASDVGANHERKRIWIVAYPKHSTNKTLRGERQDFKGESFKRGAQRGRSESDVEWKEPVRGTGENSNVENTVRGGWKSRRTKRKGQFGRIAPIGTSGEMADTPIERLEGSKQQRERESVKQRISDKGRWSVEPDVGRVAHGVAFRVDRLKCCGNGVVPQQSIPAWEEIKRLSGQ